MICNGILCEAFACSPCMNDCLRCKPCRKAENEDCTLTLDDEERFK